MIEYIEREAAIGAVCGGCNEQFDDEPCEPACCSIRERLQSIPAADVRPVVKARWKPGDIRNVSAVCSNCGHLRLGNGAEWATKLAYFCEKCGADMRPEPPKEGDT